MKKTLWYSILFSAIMLVLASCSKDSSPAEVEETGSFAIKFSNMVGSQPMSLEARGSGNYMYSTADGQNFNFSLFGYYVNHVILEGPNGEYFADEMNVSANADEVKGYYHVLQSDLASTRLNLENVPVGTYDKVTFTIGIPEDGVQQGAAGGVLDPANGAWFWNWNAGYIGFAMEGGAEDSPQEFVDWGGSVTTPANSYALHVGGWKDLPADSTGIQRFVNNIKTITLNFGTTVQVEENLAPEAHVVVDALKLLNDSALDFSTTYAVHAPSLGAPYADALTSVFILDHVHQ